MVGEILYYPSSLYDARYSLIILTESFWWKSMLEVIRLSSCVWGVYLPIHHLNHRVYLPIHHHNHGQCSRNYWKSKSDDFLIKAHALLYKSGSLIAKLTSMFSCTNGLVVFVTISFLYVYYSSIKQECSPLFFTSELGHVDTHWNMYSHMNGGL